MNNRVKKKLGIIGGVGPAATALLFERIIAHTKADTDQDHLPIAVLNYPEIIPDRTSSLLNENTDALLDSLQSIAVTLEDLGCEVIALPCNTAHALFAEIESVLHKAQLLHMPLEVAQSAHESGVKKCGILATDGTLYSRVYEYALSEDAIEVVIPDENHQALVIGAIYEKLKAGYVLSEDEIDALFTPFIQARCDGVVLGCTELSLLDTCARFQELVVIDALDVLAQKCVLACGAQMRKNVSSCGCGK